MADTKPSSRSARRRPRSPTRLVTVDRVERVTPRLTRVTFAGEALDGFGPPRPGAHMKLLFVPPGGDWSPEDEAAPRPPRRTYTPRRFDPDRRRLEVEFVHHGEGLAAGWAAAAAAGDEIYITGPGGGYDVPETATDFVLVADDTAMPAVGTILEALPPGCRAVVLCEVAYSAEERALSPTVAVSPIWLHRESRAAAGELLETAVRGLTVPPTAYWWIACEAAAMRRMRRHLLDDRAIDQGQLHTRGYWRLGEVAYPDHDYGTD